MSLSAPASIVSSPTLPARKPLLPRVLQLRESPPSSPPDSMEQYLETEKLVHELFQTNQHRKAKEHLEWISFDKYSSDFQVRFYNLLSISHLYLEEWKAAWKTANAGLLLKPEDPNEKAPLFFHQAMSLHYLGYTKLAEKEFRKILSMQEVAPDLITLFRTEIQRVCPNDET